MRAAALSAHPGPAPAPPRERAAARRPPSRVGYPADRPLLSSPFAEVMEIKHGRAAMLGITGCLLHELLGVDALYPTGGLGGAAPPTIF